MTTIGEAFVTIRPDTEGFAQNANQGIKTALTGLATGAGAAFAKQFFGDAFSEATEAQKLAAQTAAVLKSTGGAANVTAADIDRLTASLQEKAAIDDDVIRSGTNMLLTFSNIRNEAGAGNNIFDRAAKASLNLSVAMGTDLKSASIAVGKALNDPIAGVTALRRVGVQLSAEQEEQVKQFMAVGDVASAQKVILGELGKEFGGSAAAQATGAQRMQVAYANLQEAIGTALLPVIEKLTKILTPLIQWLTKHKTVATALAVVVGGALVAAFTAWAISAATAAAATLAAAAPIIAIIAVIGLVIAAVILLVKNWDTVWGKIKQIVGDALDKVKAAIGAAFDFIKGVVAGAVDWLKAHWADIAGVILLGPIWLFRDQILGAINAAIGFLTGVLTGAVDWVKSHWADIVGTALLGPIWLFRDQVFQVVEAAVGFVTGIPGRLANVGTAIADAIVAPARSAWNALAKFLNGIEIKVPGVPIPFGPDIPGFTIGLPDVPTFHTGGIFRAPAGQREGLALLTDGEQVLTRAQQAAASGGDTFNIYTVATEPVPFALEVSRRMRREMFLAGR